MRIKDEEHLCELIRRYSPQQVHNLVTDECHQDARTLWHRFAKQASLREQRWLHRINVERSSTLSGLLCYLAALYGLEGKSITDLEHTLLVIDEELQSVLVESERPEKQVESTPQQPQTQ